MLLNISEMLSRGITVFQDNLFFIDGRSGNNYNKLPGRVSLSQAEQKQEILYNHDHLFDLPFAWNYIYVSKWHILDRDDR